MIQLGQIAGQIAGIRNGADAISVFLGIATNPELYKLASRLVGDANKAAKILMQVQQYHQRAAQAQNLNTEEGRKEAERCLAIAHQALIHGQALAASPTTRILDTLQWLLEIAARVTGAKDDAKDDVAGTNDDTSDATHD
jgi:hypothetical protein